MNSQSEHTPEHKLCFILGIGQRSGTNYLYNLMKEHPGCFGPGPIWEDYVVEKSGLLSKYVDHLYQRWNPKWEVENKVAPPETLLRYFGEAIERFLRLQLTKEPVNKDAPQQERTRQNSSEILLTKTPTVTGLENIFEIFPQALLILIIRDGRAMVESGVRSFDWDYEIAMRKWNTAANTIYQMKKKYANTGRKILIVKYEDLFSNEESELTRVFNYLGLDPGDYNFASAASLGVTGSSEVREKTGDVHWQATKRTREFNPLARFKDWDHKRHDRFNWIAGQSMTRFGYDLQQKNGNKHAFIARNRLHDMKRTIAAFSLRLFRKGMYATRFIRPRRST